MTAFAELVAASNFSFLRGASPPKHLVTHAIDLGMTAIGIADRNTVAGVVRAYVALRELREHPKTRERVRDFRLIVGARLVFADGTPDIVAYPQTRHGWGRLTRLLTKGNLRAIKGDCILHFADLLDHIDDLCLIVLSDSSGEVPTAHRKPVDYAFEDQDVSRLKLVPQVTPDTLEAILTRLKVVAQRRVWLGVTMLRQGSDARRVARLSCIAEAAGVPLLATNDVLYATPQQRPLHDIVTCVRNGTTISAAGRLLEANAERHLKSPDEMARLFHAFRQAIAETQRLQADITFALDQLSYEYPHEPVPPGWKPTHYLFYLVKAAAHERYGPKLSPKVRRWIAEEFRLIRKRKYAYYFLTVYDLVRYARSLPKPILCQGRGSAANSITCFLLGVTSVDPTEHNLLFSRFVSEDRDEPPDIDVDFEHARREEVIQYIYDRYGRHRAGIAATVIHYRQRSAIHEVGKALGLTEDVTARLTSTVWGSWGGDEMPDTRVTDAGFDPNTPHMVRLKALVDQLLQFPRHLSQHVGGFVLTQDRLDETVPLHNAAMDDRTFIEWDKDDIDALGLMKVDVLALGMLTCLAKSFDLMRKHGLGDRTLELDLKADDQAVYEMLGRGDSIGVFQVESRAQINMLPRMKPKSLYDLTIQVAIVRPGPIQGNMVHPYLRRRNEEEIVTFPAPLPEFGPPDELESVLGKTKGVPLFQEQAMKLAIVAAKFSPEDANKLRRAMATFRNVGTMDQFGMKMVEGMVARGYMRDFAERCFKQIEGFGSYGFPESHALSFARLVYVSAWIKCHHPAVFACAILNSQPMGFYAPAQLVRDAREHGVEVRAIDVNASGWDNSLERNRHDRLALRLGMRQLDGFREEWALRLVAARGEGFADIEQLARATGLPQRALRILADGDAFGSIALDRRAALWEVRRTPSDELPLFAAAAARELAAEPDMALPDMPLSEEVALDYQTARLSLKDHPMTFLRPFATAERALSCAEVSAARSGTRLRGAGIVLVRQRPGKGNAIFITLEDETGITNVLLWARRFEALRRPVMAARLMLVEGEVQKSKEGVVHLMATNVWDRSEWLDALTDTGKLPSLYIPADIGLLPDHRHARLTQRHPRNVRMLPGSRDFH